MRIPQILFALTLLVVTGCNEDRAVTKGRLRDAWSQISDKDYVRVRGIGTAPASVTGQTQRRGLSRNAALVAARYEMLALIKGIKVTGGLTVGDLMQKDGKIAEIANRVIRGAEEVRTEWTDDDGCVVTLELKRDKIARLIEEDKRWEPLTEREREIIQLQALADQGRMSRAVYYPSYGEKDPMTALGLGMAFPGLGQLYAGDNDSSDGYYSMIAVITLAGAGGALLRPQEVGEARADGTREKKRRAGYGYALIGLASLLHVRAAVDGMKRVRDRGGYFVVEPIDGGAGIGYKKRF